MDQGGAPDDMNQAPSRAASQANAQAPAGQGAAKTGGNFDDFEDDIPF